jgi:hypothetical protein
VVGGLGGVLMIEKIPAIPCLVDELSSYYTT